MSDGGKYSPDTVNDLRDLRDCVRCAYSTIPPLTEKEKEVPL